MKTRTPEHWTGLSALAVLLLLAGIFVFERMLYMDSAYQSFQIVQTGSFNVEAGRFTSALPQVLPLLGLKLSLPLYVVYILFSLSYVLLYGGLWAAGAYGLRQPTLSLAIPLVLLLGQREGFFHPMTEIQQGLVWNALLFVWLEAHKIRFPNLNRWLALSITLLGILLVGSCHPVTLFTTFFLLVFYTLRNTGQARVDLVSATLFTLVVHGIRIAMTDVQSYEGEHLAQLLHTPDILSLFGEIYSAEYFLKQSLVLHLPALLLAAFASWHYIEKKQWLRLTLMMGGMFAFLLIHLITYHRGDSDIMMEKNFLPWAFFWVIPYLADVHNKLSIPVRNILVGGLLLWSLIGIYTHADRYEMRLLQLQQTLQESQKQDSRKMLLVANGKVQERLMVPWALSVESLILSSLDGPANSRSLFAVSSAEEARNLARNTQPDQWLFTNFWQINDPHALNPRYFKLPDQKYSVLEYRGEAQEPLLYFPEAENKPEPEPAVPDSTDADSLQTPAAK